MRTPGLFALVLCYALVLPLGAQEREAAAPGSAGYQISGVLINPLTSLPVGRASVTVTLSGGSFSRTLVSGEDGRFFFDQLRAGKYALTAERRGFGSQAYQEHEQQFSTAIVTGDGLESTNLVFRFFPDASLSGRITDDRNEPVRDARVMLIGEMKLEGRLGKRILGNSSTDDRGYYRFPHLKPGAYYLAVSARPWYMQPAFGTTVFFGDRTTGSTALSTTPADSALNVTYPLTFYPNLTDASAASAITLESGDHASADIILRAVAALHVRINNLLEQSGGTERRRFIRANLVQTMFDGIEVPVPSAMRETGGAVVMMGLSPGHYLLRFSQTAGRRPMEPETNDDENPEQPSRVHELDLLADTELDLTEMATAAMVSGTVKLANGQPPATPATIYLRRGAAGRSFGARSNARGELTFPMGVATGTYEVMMSTGHDLFIRNITASGAKAAGRSLRISGSGPVTLTIVVSAGAGTIDGLARRDGKPQSGAMILLVPQDSANNAPLVRRDQSDSDGTFTLRTVLPGRYTLLALENGWDLPWGDLTVLKPFLAGGEKIAVQANGNYKMTVNVQRDTLGPR